MLLLKRPLFLICSILYLLNHFILPFLNIRSIPYLNDVACLPVILTLALFIQQKLRFKDAETGLNLIQIAFTVLYITILFEGVLPYFSLKYTRDSWDVAAYILGGLFYYLFNNLRNSNRKPETVKAIA